MNRNKKSGGWKRGTLIALCAVLALVLIAMIFVTVYWKQKLDLINPALDTTLSSSEVHEILTQTDPTDPEFTGPYISGGDIEWGNEEPVVIPTGENIINILLIGQDRREYQGRQRSDAMILCTINKSARTMTLTSFLRDMYVQIPGYTPRKINDSYSLGGMKLLDATLEKNFGIQVDGNVEVDFDGFMDVLDLLGGVDIELTKEEADYLNRSGNWEVEAYEKWDLKEGMNHLTGSQALAYSRIRKIGMDFERSERQRKVLTALFEKIQDKSLLELNALLDQVLPLITTDLNNSQITNYVLEMAPLLLDMQVVTQRVPADDTWYFAWVDGMDVIVVNFEKNRQLLSQTIGG